jgi:hypothetical protein
MIERADHWNRVYTTKGEQGVSWFGISPGPSLAMLDSAGLNRSTCIIDVGGGESRLVDRLLQRGLQCIVVLDVSTAALDRARARLGSSANIPTWIAADVTGEWSVKPMDIWHDRALFHFLTAPADRSRYIANLKKTVKRGGEVVIATFALEGPPTCSGLPVVRYSPESLAETFGEPFVLSDYRNHVHRTPWGTDQAFQYSRLTYAA